MTIGEQMARAALDPVEVREGRRRTALRQLQRMVVRGRLRAEFKHVEFGGEAGGA